MSPKKKGLASTWQVIIFCVGGWISLYVGMAISGAFDPNRRPPDGSENFSNFIVMMVVLFFGMCLTANLITLMDKSNKRK